VTVASTESGRIKYAFDLNYYYDIYSISQERMAEYGYDIFPYANVESIPDDLARRFFQQINVGMHMKKVLAYKHDYDGTEEAKYKCSWYFKEKLAIEDECGLPYMEGCNDAKGNSWVAGIITQRIRTTKLEESRLTRDSDAKRAVTNERKACIQRAYERGIEIEEARKSEIKLISDKACVAYFDELREDIAFQKAQDKAAELAKKEALRLEKKLKQCKRLLKKEMAPEVKLNKRS
jgi:hypothetical protein